MNLALVPVYGGCKRIFRKHNRTIHDLRKLFGYEAGPYDHTMVAGVTVAAVALGATLFEKHFTLTLADGDVDSAFSLEPAELAALLQETERPGRPSVRFVMAPPKLRAPACGSTARSVWRQRSPRVSSSPPKT
jgi:sialic acid synthase SpsE